MVGARARRINESVAGWSFHGHVKLDWQWKNSWKISFGKRP